MHKLKSRLHHVNHALVHKAEHAMHCVYLGCVTVFAHGPYAYAAGGLLAIVVVAIITGDES